MLIYDEIDIWCKIIRILILFTSIYTRNFETDDETNQHCQRELQIPIWKSSLLTAISCTTGAVRENTVQVLFH